MTTTTAPAGLDLVLAYGPRDTDQPCLTCTTIVPANPRPDFGYESEATAQPVCPTCLRRLNPADDNALAVLRVIAEATAAANRETAAGFLWTISQGVELLTEELEDAARPTAA